MKGRPQSLHPAEAPLGLQPTGTVSIAVVARAGPLAAVSLIIPTAILATGGFVAALAAIGLGAAVQAIAGWLPMDPAGLDPLDALTAAAGLVTLAIGIARRKRLAWLMTVVAFGAAGLAQALTFGHPIGAALAGTCLVTLVATRRLYRAGTAPRARRVAGVVAVMALALLVLDSAVGDLLAGTWQQPAADLRSLLGALSDGLSFSALNAVLGPSGVLGGVVIGGQNLAAAVLDGLELAARIGLVVTGVAILAAMSDGPRDDRMLRRARALGRRYGRGALLPFQLAPQVRQYVIGGSSGLVAYGVAGRMVVVLGDPVGPPEPAWRTFESFIFGREALDQIPAVYQATPQARGRLAGAGFRTVRIGMEGLLDLSEFDLTGPRRANLRHTVARAARGGVEVCWYPSGITGPGAAETRAELERVDKEWSVRSGIQLRFTIAGFEPTELRHGGVALAAAREADGRATAFATFRATGRDGGWVLDLMRRTDGGTPGALEFCIVEAARQLALTAATTLSLGLAPLAGLRLDSSNREERILHVAARLVRPFYDVAGLQFFKAKFDPRWEPRYAAIRGRFDLPRLGAALLRLHLAGSDARMLDALLAGARAVRLGLARPS
jgi:phosphatidylglycerol lysyltransferase